MSLMKAVITGRWDVMKEQSVAKLSNKLVDATHNIIGHAVNGD